MNALSYPFIPKSTRHLARGQFWAIPIGDNCFGAGCIVGQHTSSGKVSSRLFLAGVIKWIGSQPPSPEQLANLPVIESAFAHLKVITESGGAILGEAMLDFNGLPQTAESLSMRTWGFGVPTNIAKRLAANATK
jgi:hypothetical protein